MKNGPMERSCRRCLGAVFGSALGLGLGWASTAHAAPESDQPSVDSTVGQSPVPPTADSTGQSPAGPDTSPPESDPSVAVDPKAAADDVGVGVSVDADRETSQPDAGVGSSAAWSSSEPQPGEATGTSAAVATTVDASDAQSTDTGSTDPEPVRPGPASLRAEEDWGEWGKADRRTLPFDRLKYIRLGKKLQDAYLTFGGHLKPYYELFVNENYGEVPQDDTGSFLLRIQPHMNLRIGPHFRVFTELKSTHETGRDNGPLPNDVNRLDLHQGFAEVAIGDPRKDSPPSFLVRIGRQELYYGAGRLLDVREGQAVRRTFDALVGRFDSRYVRADALFAAEVPVRPGVFDDGSYREDGLNRPLVWGVYAQTKALEIGNSGKRGRQHGFDLYYIGNTGPDLVFIDGGTGDELRHSAGARWWSNSKKLVHEIEATFQGGEFESDETGEDLDILAWGVEASLTYTFADTRFQPFITVTGGAQSGDGDNGDGTLNTYRAPFPNLRWAGVTTRVGPGNGLGGTVALGMNPTKTLNISATARVFTRLDAADGIYSPAGFPLRSADSDAHYIGSGLALAFTYRPHQLVSAFLRGEFFESGRYVADTGPSDTTFFATVGAELKF